MIASLYMLITALSQFRDNPHAFFAFLIASMAALVAGLSFHEFSHAWSANQMGDDTAKRAGRLTLNPIPDADPMDSLLSPGFLLVTGTAA